MTPSELIDLCERRINELSRIRQGFEHIGLPERVEALVDDLRATASGWDAAIDSPPAGNPAAVRANAQAVRAAAAGLRTMESVLRGHATVVLEAQGIDVMANTLDDYATALEAGQARHASGAARLRAAQQKVAGLPSVIGDAGPDEVATASMAALDAACAGYAACQDAYQAVFDAEAALRAAVSDAGPRRGSSTPRPAKVRHHMQQARATVK
ncbi:hypothetical protein [Promicromonospora soli]|uniref:Uncharacterized protein n=1 Tax=Promicromonospora soli TaxID=2035533 RepID=A0A919FRI0_9MICO|nr:hypothetical protein [Promicromonospora soli]GHH71105.1 hypothetical protein GCM10017772_18880 [Promicromonospora soli]